MSFGYGNSQLYGGVDPTKELAFNQYPAFFGDAGASTVAGLDDASSGGLGSDALGSGGSNSTSSLIQEELQMLMQLIQLIEQQLEQQQGSGGPDPSDPPGNDQPYTSASGKDWGDPHQSFNGTQSSGSGDTSGTANNMQSQSDLLDANGSVAGGYQVSTQTTPPNSNGVTYNQSATIATGNSQDTVTMGPNGQITVVDNGQAVNLQPGQSVKLSSGATVTESQDGKSVTVEDHSGRHHHGQGDIATTLTWKGYGVDVSFNASNIDLGGYLPSLGQNTAQPQGVVG